MADPVTATAARPSPADLWMQADAEIPQTFAGWRETRAERYYELMVEHGHIVERKPGDDPNLPCGWPGKRVSGDP